MKPKVALTTGDNRSENITNALDLIKDDINLTGKTDIFIKVNFVDIYNQITATHVDGVKALLAFLRERYNGKLSIGESTTPEPFADALKNYNYTDILKEYNVNVVDLMEDDWEILHLYNSDFQPMDIHYSRTMLKCDYLISISPPKTHDAVTTTLSIKNVVMGGPSHNYDDKQKIHQGPQAMNLNLYLMAIAHVPDLAVIDGMVGMEGDGPVEGDAIDWGIAIASQNAVAADSLGSNLMGFPAETVGYLYYLAKKGYGVNETSQMEILGENPSTCQMRFKPHKWYEWQKTWPDERVNKILGL